MFKLHIYLDIIKNNKSRSLFLKRNTSLKGIGMNKIYKIVWNASLGAWVAVSEIAKGKTKANSGTVGDIVIDQKNEITIKKSFNYKVLSVAVFTILTPSFAFSAVGNNSIDSRACSAAAAYSTGDIAVGCGSDSTGTNSIAIGGNATTKVATGSTQGGQSIAIGYDAQTKGDQSVGLGANVRASGNSSIAIGGDDLNKVAGTNNNTAAAQTYKSLTGDNLIRAYDNNTGPASQYFGTNSAGDGAVAIGVQASALGNLATSFGTRTQANGVASTALGVGATSDKDGSVALGAGSKTDGSATKVQSATVNGLGFTGFVGTSGFAGTASDAGRQVSVGNIGNERQIKNVAPGAISAISTDAINGSQIYAVTNTLIGQIQTTKSASPVVYTDTTGNKLTKANDGKWYLSTAVDAGGNAIGSPTEVMAANVATRLQDANGSTTTPIKLTNVADGTVAANSKDAVNGGQLKSVIDAQTATDNAAVKYDNAATKDKVTLGGATGTTITNIKDGALNASSTDAVNGRQLYATNQNVAQNTTSINALNTTVSNHGTQISTNTTDISSLKGGFTLQTNGANAGAIKAGDTVDIGVADLADTNLTATKIGKNIAFALNKDLNLTSVMTGNTVINNAGITADKVSVGNVVIDKSTNKITGIEAGTNSKDAVNKGQLDTLAAQQAATDSAAVKYDNAATKDKVSLGGATGTTITNVKAGSLNATSTDAVNGSQLYATNQNVAQNASDITTLKGGFTLQTNGTNAGAIKAGDTVDIGVADLADTNLTATKIGKDIAFALSKDLSLTSVTTGNTVINNAGLTADKVTVGNVVIDKTTNKITGIEAGTSTKDAVNKGQLDALAAQQAVTDSAAVKYDNAATKDKVTLGGGAAGTTITNVKDGALNASSTDAVNGRQLYATNQNVAQNTTSINALNTTVSNHGTQISTNTTDISSLKGGFTLQTNGANAGAIKAGDTVDIGVADLADTNLTATKTGKDIAFALSKDLSLTSVTTGNTVINNAGLTADKVTVGNVVIDKTTNKITGIEAGTNTKDAVNKGQLDTLAAQQAVTDSAAVKYDNAATKDKVTLGGGAAGTTITNVKDGALNASSTDAVNGRQLYATNQSIVQNTSEITTLKGGFTLQTNGTNAGAIKAGDTVDIGVADPTDANLTATKTGKDIAFALSKDLSLTSMTTGNTVINNAGLTADKVTVGNVVIDKTTNKITGIEAGTSTKDAVNKGQLDALAAQQAVTDSAAVKYDNAATKDKVTLGGGAAGTTITNVKAGGVNASSSDAINGSQLYAVSNNIKNAIGGSTTINAATGAITTTNIGGTGENTIDGAINSVSNTAKAAKTEVKEGDNIKVTSVVGADGQSIYTVATAKDVSFDKVTVGGVVLNKANNDITGLSNKNLSAADFATQGRAATEEQLKMISDAQTATDNAAVKYDNAATKDKVTFGGTTTSSTKDATTGKITTTGGTSLSNVASAGDYTDIANASKGVNAGDLNNAVIDAKTAVTNTGIKFGNGTTANQYKLGDTIHVKGSADGSITSTTTTDGVQLGLGNTVKVGSGATQITVDGSTGKIGGLSNKTWNAASITSGQTATEDQLKLVSDAQTATDSAAVKYDNAATKDKVTLGGGAAGTTITNVKAGAVNVGSSDAINGSQLHTVSDSVKNAIGGSTSINAVTGTITTNNIGGTGANTIDGAINNVSNTVKAAKTEVKEGDNVKVTSVVGADGQSIYTVATAKDVSFDKVTVGGVVLNKVNNDITGLSNKNLSAADFATQGRAATEEQLKTVSDAQSATDASAVKYDNAVTKDKVTLGGATGTTITNVKAGALNASSTDAVNGSQLYATNQNVAQNTASISTLNTTVSNQGTQITTNTADISTLKGGFTLQSNGANAGAIKAGNTVDIGVADLTDSNLTATKTGNSIAFALSKDLTLNSVTTNQLAVGTIAIDKATNTITGLSNKDLKAADFATKGRAATEEQLKQVISSNITEVVDASGNKVNIIDQVVNTKLDNTNQDSLFLTYNKQGQETTDRLTIGQTVQKMNTEGTKFFHTNADTSKGDLGTTNDSSASGLNSTAIGVNAIVAAGADSSVALGHNAKVQGIQSIAIGNGAEALGTQSISIGTGNKVKGNHSGAIGDPTIVDGSNSYSVGNNNQVLTDDTFVLGNNVTKTVAGSVVLGTGSAATTGAGVTGYALSTATNADKTAINKTTSTTGAVAVGDAASGIYRQITGVAAGTQDADAVNVAQLKAVGNQVVTTQNSLVNSLGGNATVNANGTITGPTYNVAKSTQSNVGDALDALDKAIESTAVTSKTTVTKGQNIVVNKSKNADGSDNYEIATAKDLTVDSVKAGNTILNNAGITIGNNTVVLNNTGLIIAGGPSVTTQGINAGNKQITNVAAGTNATDAVNKGQLDSAINNVASDVTQLSNNAVKYDTASKDQITLGGTNGTTITNVKNGAVVKDSKDAVNGGQLWNVQQQVNQNTNDIQGIQTSITNINNGKSGLVQQQTPNGDITVGKDAGGTKLNVSGTQGERVVTGVKDGAINATSKDAVNGSQLNVTNNKVAEYLGGGAKFDNEKWTAPSYTVGHGSTAQSYADVGGAVDALNKADQALGNRITNLGDRLEQAFTETNQRIDGIEQKANAGIAAAMALEAAPFVAGKYTYAVGAAYHGGENAVGVTLRKTADNGRWSLTGGVAAASQGDPSVRIGISGVID